MAARPRRLSWVVRLLIALAALVPLLTFLFPLWHYAFDAPQYPEGLAMEIWSFKLGGRVDLINGLNHYVGFMELNPDEFWELKVLPWAVALIAAGGLLAAIVGRLRAFQAWLVAYGLFAAAGMTDFFLWLYRFGHTVDPRAAITMEGYTPPMLGTSAFMNFYITALPGWGAFALAGGFVIGLAVYLGLFLRGRRRSRGATAVVATALVGALLLSGCSAPKPASVVVGQDVCDHCAMLISDARFASQVLTRTGKAYRFDSIECMVAFLEGGELPADQFHSAWVTDYDQPGKWLPAEEARYLQSVGIRSPMGANLAAFATLQRLEDARAVANGVERRYADLAGIVIEGGMGLGHDHEGVDPR